MKKNWPMLLGVFMALAMAVVVPACSDDDDDCSCAYDCCYDTGCGNYYTGGGCPDGCCPPGYSGACSGSSFVCV
jgi:hypothetical protein